MPIRRDIKKIMIIGSGPIIIGQACEFDYSGTQACKALKELGYEIVLANSNPATIMTDPTTADRTYIEPLNPARLEKIIERECPDALLPNLGGQSGLNLCSELSKCGVLQKYGVEVIGVQVDAIERGEDRIAFKAEMDKLGIEMPRSSPAYTVKEAEEVAHEMGFPVVVRPAYTMGGAGSGIVYNIDELRNIAGRGIDASLVGQVLIEECILGWEELELEVVRDSKGKMITVCFIENVDPLGVHTGDSFCSAPMLTISEDVQKRLQEQAYRIVNAIEVIGGTNVQFAHDPISDRIVVIEINPRTSRSSALASKATGFPIAKVSAMLAVGLTLDEIPCGKYGTLDKYIPVGDYIVLKFPRWAFEKFKEAQDKLGTQMKAVGEVMSIAKTFKEALGKAISSLEIGRHGLGGIFTALSTEELKLRLIEPSSERYFLIYEALKKGVLPDEIYAITKVKHYFLEQFKALLALEDTLRDTKLTPELLLEAKQNGFSDRYISMICGLSEKWVRAIRLQNGINSEFYKIHVSGTKDSGYYYSSYYTQSAKPLQKSDKKLMILGGGPNRIGQGIEFDYCCVHAAMALKRLGIETIMINCNPETVSTDYDTSDKLYFEPLTLEHVLNIYEWEQPVGVIAQFGGQTPLNLSNQLRENGVNILGTSPEAIDLAEDRDCFREMMRRLDIPMPESGMASDVREALRIAQRIGYPLMVRPSYVLGGRGMEVVYEDVQLEHYMSNAQGVTKERPILIDRFLKNALEAEADAISDGKTVFVPVVMEHIELAGVHSGDSACVLPPISISEKHIETITHYTQMIAHELNVIGLMNMQYAIENDIVYVLEANPRASRTVPLVSKVMNINMVSLATEIIAACTFATTSPLKDIKRQNATYYGVKEAVFPFNMFSEVDPILGPEMHSTGEVLGLAKTFGEAYRKAMEATQLSLPEKGAVLLCLNEREASARIARGFHAAGFEILATGETFDSIYESGTPVTRINRLHEGRPHILDAIVNGKIQLIINTPTPGGRGAFDDSYIRKAAIRQHISYITTISAAEASLNGIISKPGEVLSLQEYHASLV